MKTGQYEIIFLTIDGSQSNRPGGQSHTQHSIGFINYIDEKNQKTCVLMDCLFKDTDMFVNHWYSDLLKGIRNRNPELYVSGFNSIGNLENNHFDIGCPVQSEGICNGLTLLLMTIFIKNRYMARQNLKDMVKRQLVIPFPQRVDSLCMIFTNLGLIKFSKSKSKYILDNLNI